MTNNVARRMYEHTNRLVNGFTSKHNCTKLLYYEEYNLPLEAIQREKQIKKYSRNKKKELIKTINHEFEDLIVAYNLL